MVTEHDGGGRRFEDSPANPAARMLELAAGTADQLVADAQARGRVAGHHGTGRGRRDPGSQSHRGRPGRPPSWLRDKKEQAAELARERVAALTGLADEKAALEASIARLRQVQSDHRSQMRQHLTEQLSLLDAALPEPPAGAAD